MTYSQEFYAATVEEALGKASAALGIDLDELVFTVLDRGSAGFLGIGARDARIAVEATEPMSVSNADTGNDLLESPTQVEEVTLEEEVTLPADVSQVPAHASSKGSDSVSDKMTAPSELIVGIDEFMTALIEAMGLDATVDAYDAGDVIFVDVAVKEAGLFIGQKGETIDAVQYLLNVAIYRDHPFSKRIVVDSEGYRQRRVEAIQGMAHRTARRALREQRPLSLPPMPPAERRVVHLFLKENPRVTTSSDGEDEERRVIVSPV